VELPRINMLVRLIGPGAAADPAGLPARVEDVLVPAPGRPASFLVTAPSYPGDLVDSGTDEEWLLTWVSERGRWELPVRRRDATESGPRSWWVSPSGPVQRNQRRDFYRVHCCRAVSVDILTDPFLTLTGRTLDLSEGGLRCLLPATGLDAGTRVLVRLAFDDVPRTYGGVVLRSHRPARAARVAGWHREVAIAFDNPDLYGDALRRFVIRTQLRARRLAPRSHP
jgi:hypothetical protein